MPATVRCPNCQTSTRVEDPDVMGLLCPGCGARVALKRRAARPGPPADGAEPPRKKKRKKKPKQNLAVPIAIGVVAAVFVVGVTTVGVVSVVKDRREQARAAAEPEAAEQARAAEPPAPPQPKEPGPKWDARPDPAAKPAFAGLPADRVVPVKSGKPVFSANGRYVLDSRFGSDADTHDVIDLTTGQVAATFPNDRKPVKDADRDARGNTVGADPDSLVLLGPDGRRVVVAVQTINKSDRTVTVWTPEAGKPPVRLPANDPFLWAGFADKPTELLIVSVTGTAHATKFRVDVWDLDAAKVVRALEPPHLPLALSKGGYEPSNLLARARPRAGTAAVSPGGKYLALLASDRVRVVRLSDGALVGSLPAVPADESGDGAVAFSGDGAELLCLVAARKLNGRDRSKSPRLRCWSMDDGRLTTDVLAQDSGATDEQATTVPLPGPDDQSVVLHRGANDPLPGLPIVVLDRGSGTAVGAFPAPPLAWLPDGRLLEFAWDETVRGRAVRAVAFDREKFAREAAPVRSLVGARPAPVKADRSAVRRPPAEPSGPAPADPAAFAKPLPDAVSLKAVEAAPVKPPSPKALRAAANVAAGQSRRSRVDPVAQVDPVAFSGAAAGRLALVTYTPHGQPRYRLAPVWHRIDLRTGGRLGESVELWPYGGEALGVAVPNYSAERYVPFGSTRLALTADGTRLALRDPKDPARVDVWDDAGVRVAGLVPFGAAPIEWFGWSAGGRLVTVGAGQLTGWDVPSGKAVYEHAGGFADPAAWSPNRKWLAVGAGDGVRLIDAERGDTLGRFAAPLGRGQRRALAVAPDGRRLADTRTTPGVRTTVSVWDVTTGTATAEFTYAGFARPANAARTAHWAGPRHLLIDGSELVDLDAKVMTALVSTGRANTPLAETPDGRVWSAAGADTLRVLDPAEVASRPEVPRPEALAFLPGSRVRVVPDCGWSRNGKVGEHLAKQFADEGYPDGSRGWTLKVSADVGDSSERLYRGPSDTVGIAVPQLNLTARLLSPDGTEVWVGGSTEAGNTGQFFTGVRGTGNWGETAKHYKFDGDMRTAVVEDIWARLTNGPLPIKWPRGLVKDGDRYRPLPVAVGAN